MNKIRLLAAVAASLTAFIGWVAFDFFYFGCHWDNLEFELFLFWVFPLGFIEAAAGDAAANASIWLLVAGWVVHVLLVFVLVRARKRAVSYVLWAVFGLVLVLDII